MQVYDFQNEQLLGPGHRLDRQLSLKHIAVENYEKMNAKTAIDVISEPIERAVEEVDRDGSKGAYNLD